MNLRIINKIHSTTTFCGKIERTFYMGESNNVEPGNSIVAYFGIVPCVDLPLVELAETFENRWDINCCGYL